MEDKDFMEFGKRMLNFALKDDIDNFQPLGEIVENTIRYESPDVPTVANHLNMSFDLTKRQAKEVRRIFEPQTKPDNLKYPKRHRKWRVQKKWFNRFQKQLYVKKTVGVAFDGDTSDLHSPVIYGKIYDAILKKEGGRKSSIQFFAK